jgi:hypothetical protein
MQLAAWAESSDHGNIESANRSLKTSIDFRQFSVCRGLHIQLCGYLIKLVLSVQGQVCSLGKILAE